MNMSTLAGIVGIGVLLMGCTTISERAALLDKGMTQDEVRMTLGDKYTVRAARLNSNGYAEEVWEYQSRWTLRKSRALLIFFERGTVVSWGSRKNSQSLGSSDETVMQSIGY